MTISTTNIKNSYAGNSNTSVFQYTFKILANTELQVIIRASSGTETVKILTTHYTVSGVGNASGGNVTFTSGNIPATGETVVIRRVTAQTQNLDLVENDPFSAETVESAFDKLTSINQELQEQLDRSIKVSRTATITTPEITDDATSRAGKLLGFDATGNVLDATIDGTGIATSATSAANSATASANSATAAANSATAAENAKIAAEAALDTFDDDFLGAKSSDPTLDNDGNALTDGALYFDTTNNVMKVYDLGNTVWKQLTPTSSQQTNIDAAVANATNINAVGGAIGNVNTVAGDIANVNTLAGISGLGTLAGSASSVINAGNNLTSINSFANTYLGPSSSAPTQDPDGSALDTGDLYFDTTSNQLKVYGSSGWQSAGSTVNGTSNRFTFNVTGTPTTLTGNDANGNTLAYDAGFIDVYINGVKQVNGTDVTVSSGTSIVFASALTNGDVVDAIAFGTFQLANISIKDLTDTPSGFGTAGQALVMNSSANALEFANASSAEVYGFNLSFVASIVNYTVSVQNVGGANKYFIMGEQQPTLELIEGNTYVFSYPSAHPFALSTTADGSHGGGSEYTTGVTRDSSANTLTYVVPTGAPQLYYYCTNHSGMGGTANTPVPFNNNVQVTTTNQGQDNISAATYAGFDDVIFAASGFTFSLSNGELIATI
ncbi:MAG: putative tail fiber protein [Prokaryotic dsDNA virus sp.]|nr:MAG: putative tail fiber protein [Prokaryotic dsDNA virus sp.]|tara:strand:+ start:3640 stop:5637 length:1998 start_codon:yes stop_codon:yes gene_type:complete